MNPFIVICHYIFPPNTFHIVLDELLKSELFTGHINTVDIILELHTMMWMYSLFIIFESIKNT